MTVVFGGTPQTDAGSEATRSWYLEGCARPASLVDRFPVSGEKFTVGRDKSCSLTLDSQNVSRCHAEIRMVDDMPMLFDLCSTNGTFVNGARIATSTRLDPGDKVQFADMEFQLGEEQSQGIMNTMVASSLEQGWLISRLHEVIDGRRFEMHYQPILTTDGLRTVGLESLVRCQLPGFESPYELFAAASQLHLESRLSQECRLKAVETLGDCQPDLILFLNTHPTEQLGQELIQSLGKLRDTAGHRRIVIELHESVASNLKVIRSFRDALIDLDMRLAYDDFGAGQSRLLELIEVPPDYLKFDRSLVNRIADASPQHRSMVSSLVQVAQASGIIALAEGIDNQADAEVCCDLGFHMFQGYYFGRPAPYQDPETLNGPVPG